MVDGGPTIMSGSNTPSACTGEFYVDGYEARMTLSKAPLRTLSAKSIGQLAELLNGIKILPSEEGYLRDWRGLAHCAKVKSELVTFLSKRVNPTKELLEHWAKQNNTCTLADLQTFLGQIDRWDVIDDTNESFILDAKQYLLLSSTAQEATAVVDYHSRSAEDQVSFSDAGADSQSIDVDVPILTEGDAERLRRGLPPQNYDAFILYADEDVDFATEVIDRMETAGLKLCEKSRDLLGGTISHDAILRLIRERCHRLVLIVSPAFLRSHANTFFMTYAQALGIEQRRRKIVPIIYKKCILPQQLQFYFSLHYENHGKLFKFWDKLLESIRSPDTYTYAKMSTVGVIGPKVTITEIDSEMQSEKLSRQHSGPTMFPPPAKLRSGSSMFDLSGGSHPEKEPLKGVSSKSSASKKSSWRFPRLVDKDKSKSYSDLGVLKGSSEAASLKEDNYLDLPNPPEENPMDSLNSMASTSPLTKSSGRSWSISKTLKNIITPKKHATGDITATSIKSLEIDLEPGASSSAQDLKGEEKKRKKKRGIFSSKKEAIN